MAKRAIKRSRAGKRPPVHTGGETDAVTLLQKDHLKVDTLLRQALSDFSVVETIRTEVKNHSTVEEEIFYPAVRKALKEEGREIVEESLRDHEEISEMLDELSAMDTADAEEYRGKLEELKEKIQRHVAEEEGEMFPQVREVMSVDLLLELGSRMESRQEELQGALVPA